MIIPKNSKDVEGMRGFVNGLRAQFCSLQEVYGGELRQLVDQVVAKADEVIAKLPAGEVKSDWCADDVIKSLCFLLSSTLACLTNSSVELNKLQQGMASAVTKEIEKQITAGELFRKDAVEAKVTAAITEKTTAGDLVPKETVNQLCSAAKVNGEQAGRAALQSEIEAKQAAETTAATRKQALTAASKPLPPAAVEAILKDSDEAFKAAEAKFDERVQKFTAAGITLTPELAASCWLGDTEFAVFENTVKNIPALKGAPVEPFAGGDNPNPASANRKLPLIA